MAGKRRTDMPWEYQRAARCACFEYAATARAGVVGIRILRKIPIRIENLQQVMEHVAGQHGVAAADIELEHEMAGRMSGRR